ncbi:MAG: histidine phosphatase family protein, partial [Eubacterium sp.]|nr:histidine phosphatase family protein [Eubacterium sp.]
MEIYIIRHGKTDWNIDRRLQGRTDTELNQEGIDLAIKTGEGLKDVEFDAVYSSPLKRAYKTAELVLGERDVPIITDDRLREISFGSREGERGMAVKDDPKDPFYNFFHAPEKYNPLDGE